ncbi:glucose-6-phosphate isomerase [Hyphobacterium sp.]|uniref:glucose-6-phosphate isomerase n=1 Tax=Hyphobacterium sp. TaxID=2004662 RepID=UPI003BAA2029
MSLTREQAVEALRRLGAREADLDARDFFRRERDRLARFSGEAAGLHIDFSKQPVSGASLAALVELAESCGMDDAISALMSGAKVNVTEDRAAQHVALRGGGRDSAKIEQASNERQRAYAFAEEVRSGRLRSSTGARFRHVLHIGIGGSDLGPRLVYQALAQADDPVAVRFLSSVDPDAFKAATAGLDPATTLVFVVSKSFATPETTENFAAALNWLASGLDGDAGVHLVAATANTAAAVKAGIPEDRLFEMWDWVGGRYSLWSTVSLSVMAAVGPPRFDDLLAGAREMDSHFMEAELHRNLPVLSALIIYWHQSVRSAAGWAVVPYAMRLRLFVGWLQQLSMESLGKRVSPEGDALDGPSGPVVWGGEGPDGQHAFFQLLHQGKTGMPVDILAFARRSDGGGQPSLLANAVAQAEALLRGRDSKTIRDELDQNGLTADAIERLVPHKAMPGGRGSTFILAPKLDARTLGALLSYYEHQTYALSVLMGLNAFDQFGVELGKQLASAIEGEMAAGGPGKHDVSTQSLLQRISELQHKKRDWNA